MTWKAFTTVILGQINIISTCKERVSKNFQICHIICVSCPYWAFAYLTAVPWPPVCENCFELDATLLALVIIVDVLLTAFLMVSIYRCTKKKMSAEPTHTSKGKNALKQLTKSTALHYLTYFQVLRTLVLSTFFFSLICSWVVGLYVVNLCSWNCLIALSKEGYKLWTGCGLV